MFTTCPACRLNLAVTTADLRVGQGYVRCGRCERVFNALMSLAEDAEIEEQSGLAAHGTVSLPALEDPESADAGQRLEPTSVDVNLDLLESADTGTVETIVLEGDTWSQTEEHVDQEEVRQRLRDITGEETTTEPALELDADAAVGNPPRRHWGWTAAAVSLLLLLVGQVVHNHRQALVANRWLETPLRSLYATFGVTLEPVWDLAAYDVRQLGGDVLAPNSSSVVLHASVQNRAPHPQPPPLIRVRLQDRYGNTLSTTALKPDDYLKSPAPARMAPDQRLDTELQLEDPSRQAVGFDLDACLPAIDGAPHCAHDP